MVQQPVQYTKLNLESILFTRPEKRTSKILTFAYTKDSKTNQARHVIFQSSRCVLDHIDLERGKVRVKGSDDFTKFMSKISNYLIQLLGNHGKFFFGGKQYPLDRIQSSFVSPIQSDGSVMFRLRSNGMLISNQFGKRIPIDTLSQYKECESIVLLQFDGLCFTKNNIEPIFTVINMRVYTVAHPDEYTIDPNEDIDDTVTFRPLAGSQRIVVPEPSTPVAPTPTSTEPPALIPESLPTPTSTPTATPTPAEVVTVPHTPPPEQKRIELPVVYLDETERMQKTEDEGVDEDSRKTEKEDGAQKVMLVGE